MGIGRHALPRMFAVVEERLAVRKSASFARSLGVSRTVVLLKFGTDRIVVERIEKDCCRAYPDDRVPSGQVVMRHLMDVLVLVTVLYLDGEAFPEIRVPIVEGRECVGPAFGHRCRHLGHVNVHLRLDAGVFSELLVQSDLNTGDCAFVGL